MNSKTLMTATLVGFGSALANTALAAAIEKQLSDEQLDMEQLRRNCATSKVTVT